MTAHNFPAAVPCRKASALTAPVTGAEAPINNSGPFDTEGRRPQPLDAWAANGGPETDDARRHTASSVGRQSERGSNSNLDADAGLSAAPSKMACLACEGKGEAEYMGLCEDRYHWRECHVCEGAGLVAPYCEVCQGKLAVDGYCYGCQEYGEGFAPAGWDNHNFTAGVVIVDRDGRARVEM
jgi:hypothetical protein